MMTKPSDRIRSACLGPAIAVMLASLMVSGCGGAPEEAAVEAEATVSEDTAYDASADAMDAAAAEADAADAAASEDMAADAAAEADGGEMGASEGDDDGTWVPN